MGKHSRLDFDEALGVMLNMGIAELSSAIQEFEAAAKSRDQRALERGLQGLAPPVMEVFELLRTIGSVDLTLNSGVERLFDRLPTEARRAIQAELRSRVGST